MSETPITDALADLYAGDPDCRAYRCALRESHKQLERAANAMEQLLSQSLEYGEVDYEMTRAALAQYRKLKP